MEALRSLPSLHLLPHPSRFSPQTLTLTPSPNFLRLPRRLCIATSAVAEEATAAVQAAPSAAAFDWEAQWYPLAPLCDLDRRRPQARTVLGLDVVVWWDRAADAWRVFDDMCPHRLAPLSEGRIDSRGRLQCIYHGWCFDGQGSCQFVPQAPALGPPVHKNPKACVGVYPSVEQNKVLWFWPSTDPQYKDILEKKCPPYIAEMDDPSYACSMGQRELLYGYEVLIENLMDPAHVPYAHKGLMRTTKQKDPGRVETDMEGGGPIPFKIAESSINGFLSVTEFGYFKFEAPCLFYGAFTGTNKSKEGSAGNSDRNQKIRNAMLVFMCVPVTPGRSRVIFAFPRNFATWINKIVPRWLFHIAQNLILDSDLYLLHVSERKLLLADPINWHKLNYVPTSSDAMVIAFRSWLRQYSNGQVTWRTLNSLQLPPTPPREQLMDRYWSHVVHCSSCSMANKVLKALEVSLQVISFATVGALAVVKHRLMASMTATISILAVAILCFVASRWLSHFIQKTFYFHDYDHAFK